ncbi:MAG: flagellar basal body-associated FliL family protein [Sphingobium sp.]|nr:flagellar basal body-associated FliL family protein [Sphingobium sp.]
MSDDVEDAGKPKKTGGKHKRLLMMAGAILLLGGGGAAGGFYVAGGMGHNKEQGPKEDPNRPQLVLKGENPEEVANTWIAKAQEEGVEHKDTTGKHGKGVDLPRPKNVSGYQATYFQIPAPFTSNLSDSDAFAQISMAVGTYYDNRVIQAVQTHELAIRSAILLMLAQEQEIDLGTPEGKEKLQGKLLRIINDVLKSKTGYGGVDNVYFTNFVIQ